VVGDGVNQGFSVGPNGGRVAALPHFLSNCLEKQMKLLAIISLASTLAYAQINVSLYTPAPPAPTISGSVAGNPGNAQYNYWVIANYPSGSAVSNAALVQFVPVNLTVSNYVQLNWNSVPGVSSYDVVRLTPPASFSGSCTLCRVASGLTVTSVNDTGSALTSYTASPSAVNANGSLYINTRDYSTPQMRQTLNGVDSGLGSGEGSGVTAVTGVSPIASTGGTRAEQRGGVSEHCSHKLKRKGNL
jgi:hypothetical protein